MFLLGVTQAAITQQNRLKTGILMTLNGSLAAASAQAPSLLGVLWKSAAKPSRQRSRPLPARAAATSTSPDRHMMAASSLLSPSLPMSTSGMAAAALRR
jgi:hypothetical protein